MFFRHEFFDAQVRNQVFFGKKKKKNLCHDSRGLILIISFFFKQQSFLVETKENWGNIRQKNDREKENWWWREKHIHLV